MTVISTTFGALPEVQFMHVICHFEDQKVNNPILQTVCKIRVEMKKLEPLEEDHSKLKANFAGLRNQPLAAKFRSHFVRLRNSPEASR